MWNAALARHVITWSTPMVKYHFYPSLLLPYARAHRPTGRTLPQRTRPACGALPSRVARRHVCAAIAAAAGCCALGRQLAIAVEALCFGPALHSCACAPACSSSSSPCAHCTGSKLPACSPPCAQEANCRVAEVRRHRGMEERLGGECVVPSGDDERGRGRRRSGRRSWRRA
jgi:hypothetical protein